MNRRRRRRFARRAQQVNRAGQDADDRDEQQPPRQPPDARTIRNRSGNREDAPGFRLRGWLAGDDF